MLKRLTILFVCHFAVDMFTGVWPIYKLIGELDLVRAGFIAMIGGVIGNMLQIVFGLYADCGFRKLFIIFGVFSVTAACFFSYTESYVLLLVMVFVSYAGSSAFHPAATGEVSLLTKHKKGVVISAFISGGTLGFAFSQIIFKKVYIYFDGRTALLAIFPLIVVIIVCFIHFEEDKKSKKRVNVKSEMVKLLSACKGTLLILYLIEVFMAATIIGFIFILPEVMESKNYGEYWSLGGAHMLFVLGMSLIIIPAGHYSDVSSQKRVILLSLICASILYFVFLAIPQISLFLFIPFMLLLGGTMGICNPIGVALGNRLVPGQVSLVSGLLMGFAWGGGSFAPFLVSYLSKKFGSHINALYYMGGFMVLALILTLFIPGKQKVGEFELNNLGQNV